MTIGRDFKEIFTQHDDDLAFIIFYCDQLNIIK